MRKSQRTFHAPVSLLSAGSVFLLLNLLGCQPYEKQKLNFSKPSAATSGDQQTDSPATNGNPPGAGTSAAASTAKSSLQLSFIPESAHDAYDFTFGVAALRIEGNSVDYTIKLNRYIENNSGAPLEAATKDEFSTLCSDLGISSSKDQYVEAVEWKKAGQLFLMWRSHYSAGLKETLAASLLKGGTGIQCALNLSFTGTDKSTTNLIVAFDPIPVKTGFGGTASLDQAIKEGLMLPSLAVGSGPLTEGKYLLVETPSEFSLHIKPLAADVVSVNALPNTSELCKVVVNAGDNHFANPDLGTNLLYDSKETVELVDPIILGKAIGGRKLSSCDALKTKFADNKLQINVTCAQYQAIKDQGTEAGCAWSLLFANPMDIKNTVEVVVPLSKIAYKTLDPSKNTEDALSLLPASPLNPVRSGFTRLANFSQGATDLATLAFDTWIAIDEATFRKNFYNYIVGVNYLPRSNPSCGNFGGFTLYGDNHITWCEGGGLQANLFSAKADPRLQLYRSVLMHHESLHAHSIRHDLEVPAYAPCAGTALAVGTTYMANVECKLDYCRIMRSASIDDFKSEINYDYNGDSSGRKYRGQCKTWADAMGIALNSY